MAKPRVQITVTLSVLDGERLGSLEACGATRNEIFKMGMSALEGKNCDINISPTVDNSTRV
jgi:hypothetical protein